MEKEKFQDIYGYLNQYPPELRERMQELRRIIREEAPQATERISWGMPTFYFKGNLVHFALHKVPIGFYPGDSGVRRFEDQLGEYKHSKGAIQFPLSRPLPVELIRKIVAFRVKENMGEIV